MPTAVVAVVETGLPILLLIAAGRFLGHGGVLTDAGAAAIKRLIVTVALPAVLFRAFLTVTFDARYLGLAALMLAVLFALLAAGFLFERLARAPRPAPFLMTGFEFGMLGIGLFGTVYGIEAVATISIVGLPHEIFIWFVFVSLMGARLQGKSDPAAIVRGVVTSPVILAIVAGVILNVAGLAPVITTSIVGGAVVRTLDLIGGIVAPLILIVIGAGLRLTVAGVRQALPLIVVRTSIVVVLLVTVVPWVVIRQLGLPQMFLNATATFMLLPPPFIVPLWVPSERHDDLAYANNVLTLGTVVSITGFLIWVAATS